MWINNYVRFAAVIPHYEGKLTEHPFIETKKFDLLVDPTLPFIEFFTKDLSIESSMDGQRYMMNELWRAEYAKHMGADDRVLLTEQANFSKITINCRLIIPSHYRQFISASTSYPTATVFTDPIHDDVSFYNAKVTAIRRFWHAAVTGLPLWIILSDAHFILAHKRGVVKPIPPNQPWPKNKSYYYFSSPCIATRTNFDGVYLDLTLSPTTYITLANDSMVTQKEDRWFISYPFFEIFSPTGRGIKKRFRIVLPYFATKFILKETRLVTISYQTGQ